MSKNVPLDELLTTAPQVTWSATVRSLWRDQQEVPRALWWGVILACLIGLFAVVGVWIALQNLTVRYSPDETALATAGSRVLISDDGLKDYGQLLTTMQLSWSYETVMARQDRLSPYLHPRYRLTLIDQLEQEAKEASQYRKSQHFSPLAIQIQDRGPSTATILVYGERAFFTTPPITGKVEYRTTVRTVLKYEVAQEATSPQNLFGLLVQGFEEVPEDQWVREKRPTFWITSK